MSNVDRLLWQTEFFLSMSTKVADPVLAQTLQHAAESFLTKAAEAVQQQRASKADMTAAPDNAAEAALLQPSAQIP
jgi:hypothetical protein